LIKALEPDLRANAYRVPGMKLGRLAQTFLHQRAAETDAPERRNRKHSADRGFGVNPAGIDQPQIRGEHRGVSIDRVGLRRGPSEQMPGAEVDAVGVEKRAALLDDEYLAARAQQRVQVARLEIVEARPLPADVRLHRVGTGSRKKGAKLHYVRTLH